MNCTSIRPLLEPLAAGELADREAQPIRTHLGSCAACGAESKWIGELRGLLTTDLTETDRATLRKTPSRRWTWIVPAVAAAVLIVGIVLLAIRGNPDDGGILRPSESIVLRRDDGSTFEVRAGSVVARVDSGIRLYSGHVKATFPSSSRSRVLLPAGEVRAGAEGGAVSVDVEPQGGNQMQPVLVSLTVICLSGSVDLETLRATEALRAGQEVCHRLDLGQDPPTDTWVRVPQDAIKKFITEYRKALIDGDDKKRVELFDQIIGKERDAIGAARQAWTDWDRDNSPRYEQLKKRNEQFKKDVMNGGDEKALYELYKPDFEALTILERERNGLVDLVAELQLRESWSKNAPVLDTVVHAIRSFEYFAKKSDWANAAKCLNSGKEQDAKDLHKITVVVWDGWKERQTWNSEEVWNGQSETKVAVFGYFNGFDASGPGVRFPGARGIAAFSTEKDGTVRILTLVKGDRIDVK